MENLTGMFKRKMEAVLRTLYHRGAVPCGFIHQLFEECVSRGSSAGFSNFWRGRAAYPTELPARRVHCGTGTGRLEQGDGRWGKMRAV